MTEPFTFGLVGTGTISRAQLPVYQLAPDRVRLAAVCDIRASAARPGVHVPLETPMAVSIDECRQVPEATEQARVTFMVAQQLRRVPSYMALRRCIQAGELG